MPRYDNTILGNKAFAQNANAPMVDVRRGGQNGLLTNVAAYTANSAYVRRQLICLLLEAPRGFQDLPDPDYWVGTLKALVETQAQSIEGLTRTLTAEFAETQVGGSGALVQEDIANVTMARPVPVFSWPEKYGRPISTFLEGWIQYLLMHEETKVPLVTSLAGNGPTDLLPDYTGATMLFFEPDPLHKKVINAWLITNMMPKSGGTRESRRDLTAAGDTVTHSVEFTGLPQIGLGVDELAQTLLDRMTLTKVNPNRRPALMTDVTADVKAQDQEGYGDQIKEANRTFL